MGKQTKRKLLTFTSTPPIEEMLEGLEKQTGESRATIIRQAIQLLHAKTFKDYIEVQKARTKMFKDLNPEEKVRMELQRDDIKKDMKVKKIFDKGLAICEMLEGEVVKYGENEYNCKFECFEYMNDDYIHTGMMNLPFEDLDEEMVDTIKWKGGKEKILAVLNKQKNGKKK